MMHFYTTGKHYLDSQVCASFVLLLNTSNDCFRMSIMLLDL